MMLSFMPRGNYQIAFITMKKKVPWPYMELTLLIIIKYNWHSILYIRK